MIRKLKTGMYRIYSRSINPPTGKRKNLGTFETHEQYWQYLGIHRASCFW